MKTIRLDRLTPGMRAIIQDIEGDGPLVRRLMDLGLVPGTSIRYIRSAPLGDPLELVVRGTHLSLRRSEAARVHVELV